MRAIPALLVMAALVALAVFFADQPGAVSVVWQGWRIDTSVAVLVLAAIVLGIVAAAIFHLLRRLIGGPGAFLRARRERRRREGYRALTQGMVAVAAGDAEEAQKFARKADVLLAEPPLTLLLSAQAAQLSGDEKAAHRYFTAMLDRPETEFLGLRGLIMQALRSRDEATALSLAERAKGLRPRTPWVLSTLFELQARAGQWGAAEASLAEASRRKALPPPESRHHRAVLLHERSRAAEQEGQASEAMQLAAKAYKLDPAFAPAAARYASLLRIAGRHRHAARVVEGAWKAAPHPALAAALGEIFAEEAPLARLKRIEHLAALHPDHPESRIALAEAALRARLWGEARRALQPIAEASETGPMPRVCRLMAEIEEAERGDQGAARRWLARAAASAHADPVWLCDNCGAESVEWTPLCPQCRAFDSLAWCQPGRAAPAPRLAAGASDLAPPLPVPAPWPSAPAGTILPDAGAGAGIDDARARM